MKLRNVEVYNVAGLPEKNFFNELGGCCEGILRNGVPYFRCEASEKNKGAWVQDY